MQRILEALNKLGIQTFSIRQVRTQSLECFFVKHRLDLKRATDITDFTVNVFRPAEKDEQKMIGQASVQIFPAMSEGEIEESLRSAWESAAYALNPFFELYKGSTEDFKASQSSLAHHRREEIMNTMVQALFEADTDDDVFVNSAEIFAQAHTTRIVNSAGVDVSFDSYEVNGEYVIQCPEPQDVETYHSFRYTELDPAALQADVTEALQTTRARARAYELPATATYRLILSAQNLEEFFNFYLFRSNTEMVYQKYSGWQAGQAIQVPENGADALTLTVKATDPYSQEGVPMSDRVLVRDGQLQCLWGDVQTSRYLGLEPTGRYSSIEIPCGSHSLADLKSEPYLHLVTFSDFQISPFDGHFGGEIRLGFLYDGHTTKTITGGSLNGNILEAQKSFLFSKEAYRSAAYSGPFAVAMQGVQIAGI